MKIGGPTLGGNGSAGRKSVPLARSEPSEPVANDVAPTYDSQREETDRSRRKADPEIQDGRYGFGEDDVQMEIDEEVLPPTAKEEPKRSVRGNAYEDDRHRVGRNARYDAPRDPGRSGYYERGWDSGRRPRDERPAYTDNFYSRPRGRGYR